MASPEREQLDAIASAIARLVKRFDLLEARVARLEAGRDIAPLAIAPRPEPPPPPGEPPLAAEAPIVPASPVPQPAAVPSPSEADRLETRLGLTWINRIGVVTLIIGVAFFFKYAVDSHWIGETGRVALGVLAGLIVLGAGDRLWRRDQKPFAQGIFGLGIALLYLSFFASFGFYQIVPQAVAFVLMALTTSAAGVIALRYDAVAIAILGLLGGYATPALLSSGVDRPWTFFGYLLLLNIGAVAVARARKWRSLEVLAFAATVILYLAWDIRWFAPEKRLVATIFALACYVLFSVVEFAPLFPVAQVAVALALADIWSGHAGSFFLLSLALAAAGIAIGEIRSWRKLAPGALAGFWLGYALWERLTAPEGAIMAGLTAGFVLFYGWILWRLAVQRQPSVSPRIPLADTRGSEIPLANARGSEIPILSRDREEAFPSRREDLIVLAVNGPAYFGAGYALLHAHHAGWMGLFAAILAALYLGAGMAIWRSRPEDERDPNPALLAGGVAMAFLALAAPIQFSGYRITLGWALEAAAFTWIAARTNRLVTFGAAFLFLLTLARLDGIDAWMYSNPASYSTLFNARFLTFLVAALAFWLAAFWTRFRILAPAYYIAGHWVLLWAFSLEIVGWASRHAAPENVLNVESMTFSILVALYALVLVAIGIVKRSGINRILALILIAIVVVKLYSYDVWQLQRLYRMGAFVGLGILLLGTSYLYSRHRRTIESWWKSAKGATRGDGV